MQLFGSGEAVKWTILNMLGLLQSVQFAIIFHLKVFTLGLSHLKYVYCIFLAGRLWSFVFTAPVEKFQYHEKMLPIQDFVP